MAGSLATLKHENERRTARERAPKAPAHKGLAVV